MTSWEDAYEKRAWALHYPEGDEMFDAQVRYGPTLTPETRTVVVMSDVPNTSNTVLHRAADQVDATLEKYSINPNTGWRSA